MTPHPSQLADVAPRVAVLVQRLATPHDGEVIATARALARTLRRAGCDLNDLADWIRAPRPMTERARVTPIDWTAQVSWLRASDWLLSERERSFVDSISRWRGEPSQKQKQWLDGIYRRARRDAA